MSAGNAVTDAQDTLIAAYRTLSRTGGRMVRSTESGDVICVDTRRGRRSKLREGRVCVVLPSPLQPTVRGATPMAIKYAHERERRNVMAVNTSVFAMNVIIDKHMQNAPHSDVALMLRTEWPRWWRNSGVPSKLSWSTRNSTSLREAMFMQPVAGTAMRSNEVTCWLRSTPETHSTIEALKDLLRCLRVRWLIYSPLFDTYYVDLDTVQCEAAAMRRGIARGSALFESYHARLRAFGREVQSHAEESEFDSSNERKDSAVELEPPTRAIHWRIGAPDGGRRECVCNRHTELRKFVCVVNDGTTRVLRSVILCTTTRICGLVYLEDDNNMCAQSERAFSLDTTIMWGDDSVFAIPGIKRARELEADNEDDDVRMRGRLRVGRYDDIDSAIKREEYEDPFPYPPNQEQLAEMGVEL